jgi:hypothetical protein
MTRYYKGFKIIKTEVKQTYNGKKVTKYLYKVFCENGHFHTYLSKYTLKETKEYIDNDTNRKM